jgi:hypothetical protein
VCKDEYLEDEKGECFWPGEKTYKKIENVAFYVSVAGIFAIVPILILSSSSYIF